jgi:hypothetical protein
MISRWLDKRCEILWEVSQSPQLCVEEASTILKGKIEEGGHQINLALSKPRKSM